MDVVKPADQEALGRSEAFLRCQEELSRVARVNRPVLIVGERGTGKELAARKVHYLSARWDRPLVTLNCAALAPTLLESELFGHEAGAFTGARGRRLGRFEAAHRGSLFLDELGAMPLEVQEKLLRVVEYGSFERLGSSRAVEVDARLIAATNAHLPGLVAAGRFKADLLDRLAFEVIALPPLRQRGDDALLLAVHFGRRMAAELGLPQPRFGRAALAALRDHPWPGNVRELKNAVERAVFRSGGGLVRDLAPDPFPPGPQHPEPSSAPALPASLPRAVAGLEIGLLRQALAQARHNQRQAADLLGLSYDQFRGLYRKHRAAL